MQLPQTITLYGSVLVHVGGPSYCSFPKIPAYPMGPDDERVLDPQTPDLKNLLLIK